LYNKKWRNGPTCAKSNETHLIRLALFIEMIDFILGCTS